MEETTADGRFRIPVDLPGKYNLTIFATGYSTEVVEVEISPNRPEG